MVKILNSSINERLINGEIDMQMLRQFESRHRLPMGPFKPLPNRFTPARARKNLPKGGEL